MITIDISYLTARRDRELAASKNAADPRARAAHIHAASLYQRVLDTGEDPTAGLRRFE
jgi:hypothetical protein